MMFIRLVTIYVYFRFCAHGFQIFSEQQILVGNGPNASDYNNTVLGSTHTEDWWNKIDINFSPVPGWQTSKYVRIGCFEIQWNPVAYAEYNIPASSSAPTTDCVERCNRSQAYWQQPICRCAIDESQLGMVQDLNGCPLTSWEVFREYDYRSSMSPATYDVSRRLVYQIVTVRLKYVDNLVRTFIHAVNSPEASPKFEYDTQLDRQIFNAVWDFGGSRMVALSYQDWGSPLEFTIISFNSSSGSLLVTQQHFVIQDQINAVGQLVGSGMASIDGMSTVDILFGTYYTVVPAMLQESPQIVHVVLAIDINSQTVLSSVTLPVTLMNLQINTLQHVLYGAGADLSGNYAYYQLCSSTNSTLRIGSVTTRQVGVTCALRQLGLLPPAVNLMYLQSASLDHQYNYAWFTFKSNATGRPQIMEYHQSTGDYIIWKEDSLPLESVFASLMNTDPRVITSLQPPAIQSAIFDTAGEMIFVQFDSPTLRGAVPIDANGDEVPDVWVQAAHLVRIPCSSILDDFTMQLIPNAMCQWTSDASFFIQLTVQSTIIPGDLLRLRPGRIYRGKISPSGVAQFSASSTDFAVLSAPLIVNYPFINIAGNVYADTCTQIVLDGSGSQDYGYRGKFVWSLNRTDPAKPQPLIRQLQAILSGLQKSASGITPQVIRIPPNVLQGDTVYYFSLSVTNFFNYHYVSSSTFSVNISSKPVPPVMIYGASRLDITSSQSLVISGKMTLAGCSSFQNAVVSYSWKGCLKSESVPQLGGLYGCPSWSTAVLQAAATGIESPTLVMQAKSMTALQTYVFILQATALSNATTYANQASVEVHVGLDQLVTSPYGGTGFSTAFGEPFVVDLSSSYDPSDSGDLLGSSSSFEWSCTEVSSGSPCFSAAPSSPGTGSGGLAASRRMSSVSNMLQFVNCAPVMDASGRMLSLTFRGEQYSEAQGITSHPLSASQLYCMSGPATLLIQNQLNPLPLGSYQFDVNMSKIITGVARVTQAQIVVTIINGSESILTPLVVVTLTSQQLVSVFSEVRIVGQVTNAFNNTVYNYSWSAWRWAVNPAYDADMASIDSKYSVPTMAYVLVSPDEMNLSSAAVTRNPAGAPYLVVLPNVLQPGMKYKFRLDVTNGMLLQRGSPDALGFAELAFTVQGFPPSGGMLTSSSLTGFGLETTFTLSLTGWGSEDTPMSYRFGYRLNAQDPQSYVSYLSLSFTGNNYIDTVLPPGATMTSTLQVIGEVKSSLGSVTSTTLNLTIAPPQQASSRLKMLQMLNNTDAVTAMTTAQLLVDSAAPNSQELQTTFDAVSARIASETSSATLPVLPDVAAYQATFLLALSLKGFRTQKVVDDLSLITDRAINQSFIHSRGALGDTSAADVTTSMLAVVDSLTPGQPPASLAESRRLSPEAARARLLVAAFETRSDAEQRSQLIQVKAIQRQLCAVISRQVNVGEQPVVFALPGQIISVGKDYTRLAKQNAAVHSMFTLASLEKPGMPSIFTYHYVKYSKFAFNWLVMPGNRSLVSVPSSNITQVPAAATNLPVNAQLWYAMSLNIFDEYGNPSDMLQNSLLNATFSALPQVAAYDPGLFGLNANPATCFAVNYGSNLSTAVFDPRGVLWQEDACVARQLQDFVVFNDNLASELGIFSAFGSKQVGAELAEFASAAMISLFSIVMVIGFVTAGAARYVDDKDKERGVKPIDGSTSKVVDLPDERAKLIGTIALSFRRNHLVVGLTTFHRKMTRDRRVYTLIVAFLATEAVASLLSSVVGFNAQADFVASGIVAGVLVFPLLQLVHFMFEWQPRSKILGSAPPQSVPARPFPLGQHVQPVTLKMPMKPNLMQPEVSRPKHKGTTQPRPPEPRSSAAPKFSLLNERALFEEGVDAAKVRASLQLIAGSHSLALPKLPVLPVSTSNIGPKRPRQPPGKPRPPEGPPPSSILKASNLALPSTSGALAISNRAASFGLKLPELPALENKGSFDVSGGGVLARVPAPPSKRPGADPKPPQVPPQQSKVFVAVPHRVTLGMLPTQPLAIEADPENPKFFLSRLPAMPKISEVRGDSARYGLPPPPEPPPGPLPSLPPMPGMRGMPRLPGQQAIEDGSSRIAVQKPPPEDNEPFQNIITEPLRALAKQQSAAERPPELGPESDEAGDMTDMRDMEFLHTRPWMSREAKHSMQPELPRDPRPPPRSENIPFTKASQAAQPKVSLPKGVPPKRVQLREPDREPESSLRSQVFGPKLSPQSESLVSKSRFTGQLADNPARSSIGFMLALPPLPLELGCAQPLMLPAMPKTAALSHELLALPPLPAEVLLRVPQIRQHALDPLGQVSSAPPPPPPAAVPALENMRRPMVPLELPPPGAIRMLAQLPGMTVPPPRPPPRLHPGMQPSPPAMPPPSNAVILARKDFNVDDQITAARARPPSSNVTPPPNANPLGFVHGGEDLQTPTGRLPVISVTEARHRWSFSKGLSRRRAYRPVPDWVVTVSDWLTKSFAFIIMIECGFIMSWFAAYQNMATMWATHAATVVGLLVNLGLFEAVKCVVIACVALIKDETVKRQATHDARSLRMALKSQRQGAKQAWQAWQSFPAPKSYVAQPPRVPQGVSLTDSHMARAGTPSGTPSGTPMNQ